ncbi:MAG TPA: methyltransferase domain-containing protein [Arenimonas sp.]|nr:methyltransferase domain-containing protein [Arenimonas sp.]
MDQPSSLALGWTFFRQWLKNPLGTAAISPSSNQLARQMLLELPAGASRVIELGGGTGVFTQALLEHGIAPEQLLVLELNEELHQHLHKRFPQTPIVCADARSLVDVGAEHGFGPERPVDAVMSGLGLLSMPRVMQQEILAAAFACLQPAGRFIQFTYGPASPVPRELLDDMGLVGRRGSFTWWNVPPATVYVYTRRVSKAITPRSMR